MITWPLSPHTRLIRHDGHLTPGGGRNYGVPTLQGRDEKDNRTLWD